MRKIIPTSVILMSLTAAAFAQNPVDNQVKAAVYELERAEAQISGATAKQVSKLKRVQRMIESADSQLQASSNQSDESWTMAKARLDKLATQLNEMFAPPPAPVTDGLSKADAALVGTIDRQTDNLIKQLNASSMFDIARLRDRFLGDVDGLKQQYQRLQQPEHPQAIPVAQKVIATEAFIQQQLATLAAQEQSLGDVEGNVAAIEKRLHPDSRSWFGSPVPDAPFDMQTVRTFAQGMNAWKAQLTEDLTYLQSIQGKTARVYVDNLIPDAQRQLNSIDVYNTEMANRFENLLAGHDQIDTYLHKIPVHRVELEMQRMGEAIELLDMATAFDQAVGREVMPTDARREMYERAITALQEKATTAIADSKFPEIRSTNPELLAAAKEVLDRKEYDVNPIRRMAITYDMQRKATKEGEIDWGAVTTTVSITGYEWDEFAVTTVEEIDGNFHLFYNEFKFFHRGGSDVPTGKWTLAKRRQGTQILETNIGG